VELDAVKLLDMTRLIEAFFHPPREVSLLDHRGLAAFMVGADSPLLDALQRQLARLV